MIVIIHKQTIKRGRETVNMNIQHDEAIRRRMLAGIDALANTVKITLGPKGRNVAMHQKANLRDTDYSDRAQKDAHILVTNDGVTIAKSIVLPDPMENMGAQLLKEAAVKTNDTAGDGTTTAIVLAQSLLHQAFRSIAAGADPIAMRRGIEKALRTAIGELKASARSVDTREKISQVATISCQDRELGDMIGTALDTVGLEGVVTVDDAQRCETTLDILEGIVFEQGFISPIMATNDQKTVAELRDPYILICDTKFSDPQDLLPALICAAEDDRSCLIISDGVEGEALGLIYKNKQEGDMDIVCVIAPMYGEGRQWRMEDMAVQTGATFVSKELGMNVREVTRDMLGTAAYVRVTKDQTVITGPGGDPEAVKEKIKELRHLVSHTDYKFNRERYQERLAKFVSGVAKINVGGRTEPELWERKMRVEDAVNAARAAYEEGVVAGGGVALLNVIPAVERLADNLSGDERTGAMAVAASLKAPSRQIAVNAGLDGGAMTERLLEKGPDTGFDVTSERYVDMFEVGVIDPVKVTRSALQCALSVSATLLTTQAGMVRAEPDGERRQP